MKLQWLNKVSGGAALLAAALSIVALLSLFVYYNSESDFLLDTFYAESVISWFNLAAPILLLVVWVALYFFHRRQMKRMSFLALLVGIVSVGLCLFDLEIQISETANMRFLDVDVENIYTLGIKLFPFVFLIFGNLGRWAEGMPKTLAWITFGLFLAFAVSNVAQDYDDFGFFEIVLFLLLAGWGLWLGILLLKGKILLDGNVEAQAGQPVEGTKNRWIGRIAAVIPWLLTVLAVVSLLSMYADAKDVPASFSDVFNMEDVFDFMYVALPILLFLAWIILFLRYRRHPLSRGRRQNLGAALAALLAGVVTLVCCFYDIEIVNRYIAGTTTWVDYVTLGSLYSIGIKLPLLVFLIFGFLDYRKAGRLTEFGILTVLLGLFFLFANIMDMYERFWGLEVCLFLLLAGWGLWLGILLWQGKLQLTQPPES